MDVLLNAKARRAIFAIALSVLLLTATTAGSVWHHHSSTSAESTCPICHLSHQAAEQPAILQSAPLMLAVGSQPAVADPVLRPAPLHLLLASRAPPTL